tara:strand:- start:2 stop:997 length:996 start_codon:yes stop_codon:yes gene_type:complete
MPKVLHIGPCDSPGGMANVMRTLAEYPPEGWDADLLSSHVVGSPWAKWRAYRRAKVTLSRILRDPKKRPDVVHLHTAADWSWWRKRRFAKMAHKAGVANVVHIHSGQFDAWLGTPNSRRSKSVRKDMEKTHTQPVVLTRSWKKILEPFIGSVVAINNAVAPYIQPVNTPRDNNHVLLMGRDDTVKGHSFAKKVCEKVKGSIPELKMTMTGISSSPKDWISAVGWIDDSEKLYLLQTASILLVPSAFEGQPLVILEALTCGLPVLASDRVKDLPDSILTAPYENIDVWASIIIEMLNKPSDSSNLIKQAQSYSITSISKKWEALYSRMLGMN